MAHKYPWFPLLHTHTCYSLLDGVSTPKEWLHWCLEKGVPAVSFTDHGNVISFYDIIRFKNYTKDYNKKNGTDYPLDAVTGIPGIEVYVKMDKDSDYHNHMCIWATSNKGYANLMKLSSLAFDDIKSVWGNNKARVNIKQLLEHKEGLAFGTACIGGAVGDAYSRGDVAKAEEVYQKYLDWFGDSFYVEFHANNLTHEWDKERKCHIARAPHPVDGSRDYYKSYNNFLLQMVYKYGGKPVPVCDAHFIHPDDKTLQDCILRNGGTTGWHYHNSMHQRNPDEVFQILKGHLGDFFTEEMYLEWIGNAMEIANKAKSIDVKFDYHLPYIEIPSEIQKQTADYNEQTRLYLMERIKQHGRWRDLPEYKERFDKELDVIMKNDSLNFIPYFLVLDDVCEYARSIGLLQNIARGSAGGCLISYYLKIIHIDPIKENLPFERFLSHARIRGGSYPDIDLDFPSRPEIVKYLKDKYGLGFAQISTFTKIKTKNAIKDAMYAIHGRLRTDPEVDAVCKTIADSAQGVDEFGFLYGYTDDEDNYHQGEVERNQTLRAFFIKYPEIEAMVKRLIGVVRGWSRHASAFVIASIDLANGRVPTMRMKDAESGEMVTVTQYNGKMVENSKLVKADLLCINTLQSVAEATRLIKERHGLDFLKEDKYGVAAIYRLPEEKEVYDDFCKSSTDSAFQFNTDMIKKVLPDFIPTQREHLSALTALERPGALDAPMFDTTAAQYYIDVRQGKRSVQYVHPDLKPILKDTNGVFCYQEQVMQFTTDIVGYSIEKADIVRSAIGKKNLDVIQATFADIREKCSQRGWTEDQINTVCQQIQAFAKYSFNRSHSRAYAELGYVTMYLKHFFPLEWWTAVLNAKLDNSKEDDLRAFISLLGNKITAPTIMEPSKRFVIKGKKIVAPIGAIKGVGGVAIEELCEKGPFKSIEDFVERVDGRAVNSGAFFSAVLAGAADGFMSEGKPYAEAKKELVDSYVALRKKMKKNTEIRETVLETDPFNIFVHQKNHNMCFNRLLLQDEGIQASMKRMWPGLKSTGDSLIPFVFQETIVVGSTNTANSLKNNKYKEKVAMILLFDEAELKRGVSKKTGKEWELLSILANDGYDQVEVSIWDRDKLPKWKSGHPIFVRGTLRDGYKAKVSIAADEIYSLHDSASSI
jgi:DNA polymerase-3 subunit alpha